MQDRSVTRDGLRITEVGFGASGLGNLGRATSEADADAAVIAAWERGIRYFDTAPHYGLGLSERRLAHALSPFPRNEYVLSTKVGRLIVRNERPTELDTEGFAVSGALKRQWDVSPAGIRRSVDESLDRLATDHVDIIYIHDPDQYGPGAGKEAVAAMLDLRTAGVVRAIGVGTNSASEASELLDETDIDIAMLAGRYTLIEQESLHSALATAQRRGSVLAAVGVFNSGLLALERPTAAAQFDYSTAPEHLVQRAQRIALLCEEHGVTLPQAAIAFPLGHPSVVNVTIGMRTADHVNRNVDLYEAEVPDELWSALKRAGLLADDVPTPHHRGSDA